MRAKRLAVIAGVGLLGLGFGTMLGPGSATATPKTPMGVSASRSPVDPYQIRVAWKPRADAHHYVVELFDGITDTVSTVPADVNVLTLDAADPCAKYLVKVGARNEAKEGGTTGWMTVRSLAAGPVGGLSAKRGADRSTVAATWRAPLWGGYRPITGYRAQLVRQPDGVVVQEHIVNDLSLTLKNVDRAAKYTLLMTTQNEFGSCLVAKATISSDRPAVPRDLVAERNSKNPAAVAVKWQPPADMSAPPQYYKLGYGVGKLTKWVTVKAPVTTASLNLDPTKSWMLRVQSFNDIGGSPTLSNTVSLPAAAPAPVPSPDKDAPTIKADVSPAPNKEGWHNGPVTISFTCADTLSGVATCSDPITLTDEGDSQAVTGTATDKAGRKNSRTVSVNIDRTPPTITATVSPDAGPRGWHNGPATVTFTCSDDLSDIAVCPEPVKIPGDVAHRVVVTGTATDKAGNNATAKITVNTDRTAPTIAANAPAANGNGWHNKDVTVSFACDDALSGIDACTAAAAVTGEGAAQSVTGTATDRAGNTANTTATVNLDKTAPTIAAKVPTANADGWHNEDVTVGFACEDALSGIEACSRPVTVSAEGAAQPVTGSATDKAGNTATTTATVNVDKTAPVVTAKVVGASNYAGATNDAGWSNTPLTVTYTCTDALSGVESCPEDVVVSTDGADQTITRTAIDKAGNGTTVATTVSIDRTKPVITAVLGSDNLAGWHDGPVTVTYTCTDRTSGIAECSQPTTVSDEGSGRVTGTATDKAGNSSTVETTVHIDRTPPTITATVDGEKNPAGWYRGKVTVRFTCDDRLSGIDACPADVVVDTEGPAQSVTGTAVDKAGNTATTSVTIDVDAGEPAVKATVEGSQNAAGWYRGKVTVRFSCADRLSGIDVCPADVVIDSDGADQTIERSATDRAGNTGKVVVGGIKIDNTAPVMKLVGATNGATFTLDERPAISCQATDALSGTATQTTAKISRAERGVYTATCAGAADAAGNTAQALTVSFTVRPTDGSLAALTNVYISTSGSDKASHTMYQLRKVLDRGDYCTYIKEIEKETKGKHATLNPAQAEELTYWARLLPGKRTCADDDRSGTKDDDRSGTKDGDDRSGTKDGDDRSGTKDDDRSGTKDDDRSGTKDDDDKSGTKDDDDKSGTKDGDDRSGTKGDVRIGG